MPDPDSDADYDPDVDYDPDTDAVADADANSDAEVEHLVLRYPAEQFRKESKPRGGRNEEE